MNKHIIKKDYMGEIVYKVKKVCPKCKKIFKENVEKSKKKKVNLKEKGKLFKVKIIPPYEQSFGKMIRYYKKNIKCGSCDKVIGYVLNKAIFTVKKESKIFNNELKK